MGDIFLLSLASAANATLLAAVTVMLFLPSPRRLLLGYLAGGLLTSLTIGFLIVFVVHDASATTTARNAVSPSIDIAFGLILLLAAYVLHGGHDQRLKERRRARSEVDAEAEKPPQSRAAARPRLGADHLRARSRPHPAERLLSGGIAGAAEARLPALAEVLVILGFNLMMLILLVVPLVGFFLAPERTVVEVQRFRAWLTRSGRRMAIYGAAGLGVLLVVRGVVGYLGGAVRKEGANAPDEETAADEGGDGRRRINGKRHEAARGGGPRRRQPPRLGPRRRIGSTLWSNSNRCSTRAS